MKKLFENFHQELQYIETVKSLLDDRIFKKYGHRESVQGYKKSLENIIVECNDKKYYVLSQIEKLEDPLLREIFYMRYIDRKPHSEIAHTVGHEVTYISKLIRKSISYLENLEAIENIKNTEDS